MKLLAERARQIGSVLAPDERYEVERRARRSAACTPN